MGYSRNTFQLAKQKIYERRLNAEHTADRRREIVFAKVPRLAEIEKEISSLNIKTARIVIGGGDVVEEMKKLRDRNLYLQSEFKELLAKNGYSENVLEPKYVCKKCNDSGYFETDDERTVMCTCLKNMLITCACEELNRTAPLSLSTFESFDIDLYDKKKDERLGISPYFMMSKIFEYCKKYADNFTPMSENILMKGNTGLGKTHLSLAIANEVIKKGYGVIYVSAPTLLSRLEKNYFSNNVDDNMDEMLTSCDLLIIDDIGTEFRTLFSSSQLYNICNTRMLLGKPMIVNTNLTAEQMSKNYTDRFVSRIFGNAKKLDFLGEDIRVSKNL